MARKGSEYLTRHIITQESADSMIKGEKIFYSQEAVDKTFGVDQISVQSAHKSTKLSRRPGVIIYEDLIKSLKDPEELYIEKHKSFIIKQDTKFKLIFDICMNILIFYSVGSTLYYLALSYDGVVESDIDDVFWGIFIIDFILNFITEIKDDKNRRVFNVVLITKNYLKNWMIFDLFALMPLRWTGNPNIEYIFRLSRIGKLKRLFEMVNMDYIAGFISGKVHTKYHKKKKILKIWIMYAWDLFQVLSVMIFVSYLLACIWWYWSGFSHRRLKASTNYINYFNLESKNQFTKLLTTLYFTFSTLMTVGYGDFHAINEYEMMLSIVILIVGPTWFAFTMGKAINIIRDLKEIGEKTNKAADLAIWISNVEKKFKYIPKDLKNSINTHYTNYWKNDRLGSIANEYKETHTINDIIQVQDFYLREMPDKLRKKVLNYLFDDIFHSFDYFFLRESECKYFICIYLQPRVYLESSIIINVNEDVNELLFTKTGKFEIGFMHNETFQSLHFMEGPHIVGDYFVFNSIPSFLKYISKDTVHGYSIPAHMMTSIIKHFFKDFQLYLEAVENNFQELKDQIEYKLNGAQGNSNDTRKDLIKAYTSARSLRLSHKEGFSSEKTVRKLDTIIKNMKESNKLLANALKKKILNLMKKDSNRLNAR
jgi:Ion channel